MRDFINGDCIDALPSFEDNQFDLAIVDPPYGIGWTWKNPGNLSVSNHEKKDWNKEPPPNEYFNQLRRVSKNQIIWGGNYFTDKLPVSRGWVCWDKITDKAVYSDFELAWTSFDITATMIRFMWNGMMQGSESDPTIMEGNKSKNEKRIHPTQKPVGLYRRLLRLFMKVPFEHNPTLLDTHVGSASSLIAFEECGFNYIGFEKDKDYYEKSLQRLEDYRSQLRIFKKS